MRLKEFVNEDTNNVPKYAEPVMSRLFLMPGMSSYYEFYRFMTLTAGEPTENFPTTGNLRDVPVALAYTQEEQQMVLNAMKRMGKKGSFATGPGSEEPSDTNKKSPVSHNSGQPIKKGNSASTNEIINEVADKPYRSMLTKKTDQGSQYMFVTDAGTRMLVSLSRELLIDNRNRIEISFAEQTLNGPTINKTGKGDAFRVFATVAAIVKEYVAKSQAQIDELTFTGKTKDPSRIKLYDRIARSLPKVIPEFNLKGSGSDGVDKVYYFERYK